jgi:predicted helicase
VTRAQKQHGLPEFDLIICDEAHRTTGATLDGEDESQFRQDHSNDNVEGRKRLYMTATPRIFGDNVAARPMRSAPNWPRWTTKPSSANTVLSRLWLGGAERPADRLQGHRAGDGRGLVSAAVQKRLGDAGSELVLDDATKIIGCYKALTKIDLKADVSTDPHPMRRALAFCQGHPQLQADPRRIHRRGR